MQIEPSEVRWLNQEAKATYEEWQKLIEKEWAKAKVLIEGDEAAIRAALSDREIEQIYRETRERVNIMATAAARIYAGYTMPVHVIARGGSQPRELLPRS